MMFRYYTGQLLQVDINPGCLRIGGLACRRRLFDTEAVCAVVGDVEPSQRREFQTFFRAAMTAVPEAVEAIGLLTTFGYKTGIDHQCLFMFRRDHLDDRRLVEEDKVKVPSVPTGKGSLVIRGIRVRRDSWNMTAITQKCTTCPSLAAAALEP